MARKYSKKASKKVGRAMRERKRGTLRSGRSGRKVKSRKQAIAIGLSEARREGDKVPKKKTARRASSKKSASKTRKAGQDQTQIEAVAFHFVMAAQKREARLVRAFAQKSRP